MYKNDHSFFLVNHRNLLGSAWARTTNQWILKFIVLWRQRPKLKISNSQTTRGGTAFNDKDVCPRMPILIVVTCLHLCSCRLCVPLCAKPFIEASMCGLGLVWSIPVLATLLSFCFVLFWLVFSRLVVAWTLPSTLCSAWDTCSQMFGFNL